MRITAENTLGYEISCKVVDPLDEAIEHINRFNTGHSSASSPAIMMRRSDSFEEVDAAAVYVNASTRFTDGFEFGFGAEIGISTQKLHARGPMGLTALTTTKLYHLRKRTGAIMDKTMEKELQVACRREAARSGAAVGFLADWQPEPNHQHGIQLILTRRTDC